MPPSLPPLAVAAGVAGRRRCRRRPACRRRRARGRVGGAASSRASLRRGAAGRRGRAVVAVAAGRRRGRSLVVPWCRSSSSWSCRSRRWCRSSRSPRCVPVVGSPGVAGREPGTRGARRSRARSSPLLRFVRSELSTERRQRRRGRLRARRERRCWRRCSPAGRRRCRDLREVGLQRRRVGRRDQPARCRRRRRAARRWRASRGDVASALIARTPGARRASRAGARRGSRRPRRRCRTRSGGSWRAAASRSSSSHAARGSPSRGWPTLPGFSSHSPLREVERRLPARRVSPVAGWPVRAVERERDVGVADQVDAVARRVEAELGEQRREHVLPDLVARARVVEADVGARAPTGAAPRGSRGCRRDHLLRPAHGDLRRRARSRRAGSCRRPRGRGCRRGRRRCSRARDRRTRRGRRRSRRGRRGTTPPRRRRRRCR